MAENEKNELPLGGENEASEHETATPQADAVAIAVSMDAAATNPATATSAAAFLDEQKKLVMMQTEHFNAERPMLMRHTHLKVAGAELKHWAERLRLGLLVATAGLVLLLVAGFLTMLWNAAHDHALVIESFAVPPDIAEHQIKGEELAALVADKLATIDVHAKSFRAEKSFQTDWGHEIHIEVPGTGISLAELSRAISTQFGNQTRIGGTLYHAGDGLHLSLRAGEGEASEVAGDTTHVDALAQRAAEAVFGKTQTYRYSKYLEFAGRTDEAMAVARQLTLDSAPNEQAWAWAQISNLLARINIPEAYRAAQKAIVLNPNNALAYVNASNAASLMGHDGESYLTRSRVSDLAQHGGGDLSAIGLATSKSASSLIMLGDYLNAVSIINTLKSEKLYSGIAEIRPTNLAQLYALVHDLAASEHVEGAWPDAKAIGNIYLNSRYLAPTYARAIMQEDWPAAIAAAQSQLDALAKNPEGPELAKYARERFVLPHIAFALAKAGKLAESWAIAAPLASDCYLCLRTRAQVAAMRGDWDSANRDFSEAIRQNSSLPMGDYDWGRALLDKGDLTSAIVHFAKASQLGPHFADPLKYWGDALMKQGKRDEARAKYQAALKFAPQWVDLKAVLAL